MHVSLLINLLNCLIFTIFEVGDVDRSLRERDVGDIDTNDIVQGGIYDYLKNVSTWVMTEYCSNYLNFLLYTPL